jgi:protein disulfide-isomerase A6
MIHTTALTVAAAALLAALPVDAGLYSKNSPVLQIDGKNYDRLIAQSNHTSVGTMIFFFGIDPKI